MKSINRLMACLVGLLALVLVAGLAAADSETVTVSPSSSQSVNLGVMNEDDLLTLSWTSNTAVSGVLSGPSGWSETYSSSSFGYDLVTIPRDGAYTLTFTNPSSTTAASVDVTFNVSPFNPIDTADDIVTWVLIIGVIVVVIIVVIVVLVVVLGSRNKQAAAAAPVISTPMAPGMCPVCGAQTDTNAPFCAKCGARFR